MMRKLKKTVIGIILVIFIVALSFFTWLQKKYVVPILVYHHVDYVPEGTLSLNTVSPSNFARQMMYLRKNDYIVLRFYELVNLIESGEPIPRKSVVVTFDDGYEDNYKFAFKILKKNVIPATIFIVTDLVGVHGYLTWDEIKEMQAHGIFIGSHSRRHPYLPDLTYEQQVDEIKERRRIRKEKLGTPINFFAYPSGGFNKQIVRIVKEAGYLGACTTNRGFNRLNTDVYELKRIRIKNLDSDFAMWMKLSGFYNLFRAVKNPE